MSLTAKKKITKKGVFHTPNGELLSPWLQRIADTGNLQSQGQSELVVHGR